MKILVNDEIDTDLWEEFVSGNPHANPFQTPAFYELVNHAIPSSGQAVCVFDHGKIRALAVVFLQKEKRFRSYFSRRGLIFGGPLIDPDCTEALNPLLEAISLLLRRRVIYIETRNLSDYEEYITKFSNSGWIYSNHLNCILDIKDRESVYNQMNATRRRQIRQSLKNGASYEVCRGLNDLEEFYSLLNKFYTKVIRLPLPPPEIFKAFFQYNFGKIFVVRHNGRIIGGSICPILENKTIYSYYYYGLKDYHKNIYPSHLSIVAAIEYAVDNNLGKLDFMGAGKSGTDYGVRDYKLQFGGHLVEYGRFIRIERPSLYRIGKMGLGIIRHLGI